MEELIRNLGGRPSKFKSAADLMSRFIEYIDSIDNNPWQTLTRIRSQRNVNDKESREMGQREVLLRRPYTLDGFCLFAGITNWSQFKKDNSHRKGFLYSISRIEMVIRDNQITGAILGEFKENIISRLNGILDKSDITSNGKTIGQSLQIEIIDNRNQIDQVQEDSDE